MYNRAKNQLKYCLEIETLGMVAARDSYMPSGSTHKG